MLLSRRSTLAYGSAFSALATNAVPATAQAAARLPENDGQSQRIQHLVIHRDEAGGTAHVADLSLPAPDTAWAAFASLSDAAYRSALQTYRQRTYGLVRVNAFQTRGGMRYAAIWQFGRTTPSQVRHDMTAAQFRDAADTFKGQGYALTHLDGCATAAGARFAAIWEKAANPTQTVLLDLTAAEFKRQRALLAAQGLGPRQIAGYANGGAARFAAVFTQDAARAQTQHAIPAAKFHARSAAMLAQGYQLKDASGYVAGRQPFYTAVWDKA